VPTIIARAEDLQLLEVNDAFTAALGYAAVEAVGRTPGELGLWAPSISATTVEQELARTGTAHNRELQLRAKDGRLLDCLLSTETVDIQGRGCLLAVLQDITERKHSERELIAAIEAAMEDASWFSRAVLEKLARLRHPGQPGVGIGDLSERERELLGLLCEGLTDKATAERLGLSHSRVRNILSQLYRKLAVRGRSAAVAWACERGLGGKPRARIRPPAGHG
jgi:PAS domain S-box-containing protein